jgi:hypothetical protein
VGNNSAASPVFDSLGPARVIIVTMGDKKKFYAPWQNPAGRDVVEQLSSGPTTARIHQCPMAFGVDEVNGGILGGTKRAATQLKDLLGHRVEERAQIFVIPSDI